MYKSTDEIGKRCRGHRRVPGADQAWTGGGPRPLVSYAEGTQGQGDACAPSRTLQSTLTVESGQTALGYEVPNIYSLLDKGVAVVVTDYIGLGTPDRIHTTPTARTWVTRCSMRLVRTEGERCKRDPEFAGGHLRLFAGWRRVGRGGGAAAHVTPRT